MNRRVAQIVHTAMVGGVVAIALAFGFVREVAPAEPLSIVWVLRLVAFAEVVGVLVIWRVLRAGMQPLRSHGDEDAWWQVNGPRALVIWALADGSATVGAVFWYLTGDASILLGVLGVSLLVLLVNRPGTLVGD
jgi:hypothetical protein